VNGFWIAVVVVLWFLVALLAFLVLGLLRRIAPVLERAEGVIASSVVPPGIGVGTKLPRFELRTSNGEAVTASEFVGEPFVLLFVSSGCAPCRGLIDDLSGVDTSVLAAELVIVIDQSDVCEIDPLGPKVVVAYQKDHSVSDAFGTSATPHAFAIDRAGRVAAVGFPNTLDQLVALTQQSRGGGDASEVSRDVVRA
jgi:hypothetical protein